MNIFIVLLLAMILMVILLRKKVAIGPAILGGGVLIWAFVKPDPMCFVTAGKQMLTMSRTYDLLFALYFVVCLEIELRKSGCLAGMMKYLGHLIPSTSVMLATMPAFLGLLPSIGGARFSAPIVDKASEGTSLNAEQKSAINFWFRHVFETASPIIPGMILACNICNVNVGDLIIHLAWVGAAMFAIGWLVLITPYKVENMVAKTKDEEIDISKTRADFILCLLSVVATFCLMVFVGMRAGTSMGVVAFAMYLLLIVLKRGVPLKDVFIGAIEKRLFRDVGCILFFIQILDVTGVLSEVVHSFDGAPLPAAVIIAITSFIIGILTGLSQGHVAIMMPVVAGLAPGSLDLVGVALVFGVGGQMITPTHVCLMVTLDYFKADFFKTLWPCIFAETILLAVFSAWTYMMWGV